MTAVLDALAFDAPDVSIVGESVTVVHHVLAAAGALDLPAIQAVVSHPVALGQCGAFLRERLPGASAVAVASTAEALRAVVAGEHGPNAAGVGPEPAARRYGATVLAEHIEDDIGNRTRFAWLARDGSHDASPEAADSALKTSVLFHGDGDGSPGWLVRCLSEFAFRGVNLTRIESRPLRSQLGHYAFHVDCEGHSRSSPSRARSRHCAALRGRPRARLLPGAPSSPSRTRAQTDPAQPVHPLRSRQPWGFKHHQTQGGSRRLASTSDVDVKVVGCSSSTPRMSRSTSARCGERPSCC